MPDIAGLGAIAVAFLIVAASPGPANLACAAVAMRHGRSPGLIFGFGLGFGLAFWGLLAAAGLGAVLKTSETLLVTLKAVGAAYLFWLALLSGRSATRPAVVEEAPAMEHRWFWPGLMLNLSNPKAVFAWMAALAFGLDPSADLLEVAFATGLCSAIGWINYALWASLFSLSPVMAGYRCLSRWIDAAMAGLFATAGIGLLRSAFAR